jgi:hypothetical protein
MTVEQLRSSANRPMKLGKGYFGLSVSTFRWSTPQQIATRGEIPHSYFCVGKAGAVRRGGLAVQMRDERKPGHAVIFFNGPPSDEDLRAVIDAFGRPVTNRTAGPPRRRL